jgi:transcriptional regulator with XRE-family HTH domain
VPNERLKGALNRKGLSYEGMGRSIGVDPKTVERWVAGERVPHARNRYAAATVLGENDAWLWPAGASHSAPSELVQLHATRASLPASEWLDLFSSARVTIDLLVYAALFLPEQVPRAVEVIGAKARAGTRVRLLLGDPDSAAVEVRGVEEGIGADAVALKIRNSLALLQRTLYATPNLSVRLHASTLYASIYRADEEMIVNLHVVGLPAAQSPALHLRRTGPGGLFDTYGDAYERVWRQSKPAWEEVADGTD